MLLAKKIGGHSGMLKSLVVGPREASKLTYLLGLAVAGAVLAAAVPHTFFEKPKDPELSVFALGVVMGIGTHLGNGCTSGHGLWGLFMVALLTTFGFYRFAKYRGVAEACAVKQGRIDWQLLLGAALFGIGWGATGACPGPLVVIVGANPLAMGPLLILLGVSAGVLIASAVTSALVKPPSQAKTKPPAHAIHPDGPPPPSPLLSPPTTASNECFPSAAELRDALDAGAVLVDLRNPVSSEATGGALLVADGAVSAPWDRATRSVPLTALPSDKAQPP